MTEKHTSVATEDFCCLYIENDMQKVIDVLRGNVNNATQLWLASLRHTKLQIRRFGHEGSSAVR